MEQALEDSSKSKGSLKGLFKSSKNDPCYEAIDGYVSALLAKAKGHEELWDELKLLSPTVPEENDSKKSSKKDKSLKSKKTEELDPTAEVKQQLQDESMKGDSDTKNDQLKDASKNKEQIISLDKQAAVEQESDPNDSKTKSSDSPTKVKKSFFKKQVSVDEQAVVKEQLSNDSAILKIEELIKLITEMFDENASGHINPELCSQIYALLEELTPFFNEKFSADLDKCLSKVKKALKAELETIESQKSKTVFQSIFKNAKAGLFQEATVMYIQTLVTKSEEFIGVLSEALKPLAEILLLRQQNIDSKEEPLSADQSEDKKDKPDLIPQSSNDEQSKASQTTTETSTEAEEHSPLGETTNTDQTTLNEKDESFKVQQESLPGKPSEEESPEADQTSTNDKSLIKRKTSFRDKIFKKKQPSLSKQVSIDEHEAIDEELSAKNEASKSKQSSESNKTSFEKQVLLEKHNSVDEQPVEGEENKDEETANKSADKKSKKAEKASKKEKSSSKGKSAVEEQLVIDEQLPVDDSTSKTKEKEPKPKKSLFKKQASIEEQPVAVKVLTHEEAVPKIQEMIKLVTDMFEQNTSGQINPELCTQICTSFEELTSFFNEKLSIDLDKFLSKMKKALKKINSELELPESSKRKQIFQVFFKLTKSDLFYAATVLYVRTLVTKFNENPGDLSDVLNPLAELLTLEDKKTLEKEQAAKQASGEEDSDSKIASKDKQQSKKAKDSTKTDKQSVDSEDAASKDQSSIEEQSTKPELLSAEEALIKIQELVKLVEEMFEQNKTGQIEPELCTQMYNILKDLTPYFVDQLNIDLDKYLTKMKKALKKDMFELDLPDSSKRKQILAAIFKYTKSGVFFGTAMVYFRKLITKSSETPGELNDALKELSEIIAVKAEGEENIVIDKKTEPSEDNKITRKLEQSEGSDTKKSSRSTTKNSKKSKKPKTTEEVDELPEKLVEEQDQSQNEEIGHHNNQDDQIVEGNQEEDNEDDSNDTQDTSNQKNQKEDDDNQTNGNNLGDKDNKTQDSITKASNMLLDDSTPLEQATAIFTQFRQKFTKPKSKPKTKETSKKQPQSKKEKEDENDQKSNYLADELGGSKTNDNSEESAGVNRFGNVTNFDEDELAEKGNESGSMGIGGHQSRLDSEETVDSTKENDQNEDLSGNAGGMGYDKQVNEENDEQISEEEQSEDEDQTDDEEDNSDETEDSDYDSEDDYDSDMEDMLGEFDSDDEDDMEDIKSHKVVSAFLKIAKKALSVALDVEI
ncbi:putative leucine-rich repeat-containing protein DDB_G0290503 [Chironomus tepperi]|uniref:putative leucine-rich repeat-containing protein DDB_G0290503 n=1 Tax=Chironomus tepperi TaxID=113505 RepID=UPI00391F2843